MKKIVLLLVLICISIQSSIATEIHSKSDIKKAKKEYSKLIKKDKNNWVLYYNKGLLCYEQGGDYILLCTHKNFKKAYELNSNSEDLKHNYLLIKDYKDKMIRKAIVSGAIGGAIGGAVASATQDVPPTLKYIDTKVWEMITNK